MPERLREISLPVSLDRGEIPELGECWRLAIGKRAVLLEVVRVARYPEPLRDGSTHLVKLRRRSEFWEM